jgi:hypothetical protein
VRGGPLLSAAGLALLAAAGPAAATGLPEEVEAYRRALGALPSPAPAAVEQVFARGLEAGRALLAVDAPGGATALETLGEPAFQAVAAGMPGFTVTRQESVRVTPDLEFFLALARRHGEPADVRFFESYRQTVVAGGWPVYVEPQTDSAGCTRYGSLRLVEAYRRWTDYRRQFPGRYAARVGEFIETIEAELAGGRCACGARASVLGELRAFLEAFPGAPIAPDLRARVRAIEAGTSDIRFVCVAG